MDLIYWQCKNYPFMELNRQERTCFSANKKWTNEIWTHFWKHACLLNINVFRGRHVVIFWRNNRGKTEKSQTEWNCIESTLVSVKYKTNHNWFILQIIHRNWKSADFSKESFLIHRRSRSKKLPSNWIIKKLLIMLEDTL